MKIHGLILTDEQGNQYQFIRIRKVITPEADVDQISKWLKLRRKMAGLTQLQLAERAGMLQPNICAYERGTRIPNEESLRTLRAVLSEEA